MKRYLPIAAILLLAAIFRLHALGRESLWFDEALTLWLCKLPYWELIENLKYYEQTPPLIHVATGWFVYFLGDSEAVLRLPAALAGIGAVAAIYAVGRRVAGESAGLLAALLLACCPFAIYYAQEARAYSFVLCLSLLSTHAFLILLANQPRRRAQYAYYILTTALLFYAHPFGAVVVLCQAIAFAYARRRKATSFSPASYCLALVLVGVLFAPWLPILRIAMQLAKSGFWIPPSTADDISAAYWIYCNTALALVAFLIVGVFGAARIRRRADGMMVVLLATAPVLLPIAASIVLRRPTFTPRYGISAVGGICLLGGIALAALPLAMRIGGAVLLIAAMFFGVGAAPESPGFSRQKAPWREYGKDLHDRLRPGDLVLYSPGFTKIHFDYYVRRPDVRQVPFLEHRGLPAVNEDRFWLIVSIPTQPTYALLASGQWRVASSRIYGDMLVLELQRAKSASGDR